MVASRRVRFTAAALLAFMVGGCSMSSEIRVEQATVAGITFLQLSDVPKDSGEPEALFEGTLGADANNCAVLIDENDVEHGFVLPADDHVRLNGEKAEVMISGHAYLIGDSVSLVGGYSGGAFEAPEDCSYSEFFLPNSHQPAN